MSYKLVHEQWIKKHLAKRHGERKDALRRGHGYGNRLFIQKVWWPLQGQFSELHPEYEVKDWRGRSYFVDFMLVIGGHYIVIEIMDYGSHGTDRTKYRMDVNRALYLQAQGYRYIEVSLDELKENPSLMLNMLKMILAPYLVVDDNAVKRKFTKIERGLMHYAIRNGRLIRPSQAARELELYNQTVIKYCQSLVEKGKLRALPSGASGRISKYEYLGSLESPDLL